jgi:type I restriction enzyme, S subunit
MLFDYRSEPEIPADWRVESIENLIVDIGDGGTPPRADPSNFGGGIAWAVIEDLRKDITSTRETLSARGVASSNAKVWPVQSVVVSTGATIGRVGVARVPLATKQGITGIIPNKKVIFADYLAAVLMMGTNVLERFSQGSTFKEIRPPTLKKLRLRVPKVDEQSRIAAVLDAVDEAIAKTEAVIAKLRQVRAGLLHDLLTRGLAQNGQLRDPIAHPEQFQDSPLGRMPREWRVCGVLDVAPPERQAILTGPFGAQLGQKDFVNQGVPVLRIGNVQAGYIDWSDTQFVTRTKAIELKRYSVIPGDLLFARQGATTGRNALADERAKGALINYHIIRVATDRRQCEPIFLHALFNAESASRQINRDKGRGTREGINTEQISSLRFALPSIDEQRLAVAALSRHDEQTSVEEAGLAKLQHLKSGLMTDLLTGGVRVPELDIARNKS